MSPRIDEPTRRRWRRRLLVAGLLPLLLAVAFAAKVAVMLVADDAGRTSYAAGDFEEARGSFATNAVLNVLEPWVSPYDEGTARYRLDDFPGAVRLLSRALETVPPEEECRVRINLALAHESVGDTSVAGGDLETAREQWRAGATVLREGGCRPLAPGDDDADADEAADDRDRVSEADADRDLSPAQAARSAARAREAERVASRLRDKLQQPRRQRDDRSRPLDPDAAAAAAAAAAARAAELEERNERAQRERREAEQRRQDREARERQEEREQQQPPDRGDGDGEGEPLVYEW